MNVNSIGSMQQMQMRKMDGSGQGKGMGREMRSIMQQLPEDTRNSIKEQMQNLTPTQRKDVVSQITKLDTSQLSTTDLTSSIMNILNSVQSNNSNNTSSTSTIGSFINLYA